MFYRPVFALIFICISYNFALPAKIEVTTLYDVGSNIISDNSDPAGCNLRDAITAANTDQATGACSAGSGADHISFTPELIGRISLISPMPDTISEMRIIGQTHLDKK